MGEAPRQDLDPAIEYAVFPNHEADDIEEILSKKRTTLVIKRIYDVIFSALGLLVLLPLFAVIAVLIKLDSPGPVFYQQTRIGKDGQEFKIYKFRKMHDHVGDGGSNLTLANDQRMTRIGAWLRKTKIDELPQAFNVLKGDMAVVGPRPETPDYVELFTPEQRQVLKVKQGITDYASIYFINEGDLLEQTTDPETYYINSIMPQKIRLNLHYIQEMSFATDMKIIFLTFKDILASLGR
jgi:lipopolysaccharide/colanic/teichoic acid biosynthesis glycosyltransferase